MAGIGFELRKLLKRDDYLGLFQAYGIAGLLSSGPWILSSMGVLAVALIALNMLASSNVVVDFLVSVTYLMAFSFMAAPASAWQWFCINCFRVATREAGD